MNYILAQEKSTENWGIPHKIVGENRVFKANKQRNIKFIYTKVKHDNQPYRRKSFL